jgi:antitoxin YefM
VESEESIMLAIKSMDVLLSEKEYNEMLKAKQNADYLAMVDKSIAEAEAGQFIVKTVDELEALDK